MVTFDKNKLSELLKSLKGFPQLREVRELRKRLQKEAVKIKPKPEPTVAPAPAEIKAIAENAIINLWVDLETRIAHGVPLIKINYAGNRKLNQLTGKAESFPTQSNVTNIQVSGKNVNIGNSNTINSENNPSPSNSTSINWTKWGTVIGVLVLIVTVIGVLITLPTSLEDDDPYFTNIGSNNIQITNNEGSIVISKSETTDPEFTIINQEFVNCDALPDGLSGFSYIDKSLGFMISWPDANWILIEDVKSHRASYGLGVGESYLGGVNVSKDPGQSVMIAVFDKSDSIKNDFEKWLTLQAEGYDTKVVSGKANIRIDPDKNSATLEIDAMIGDDHFTMKERVLKNNDMIYLIQKHLFGMEKHPNENPDESELVRKSIEIFTPCL